MVATNTSTTPIVANLEEIASADDPLMFLASCILSDENLSGLQQGLEAEPDEDEEGSLLDVVRSLRGIEKEVNWWS